jgi:hypothetical protein
MVRFKGWRTKGEKERGNERGNKKIYLKGSAREFRDRVQGKGSRERLRERVQGDCSEEDEMERFRGCGKKKKKERFRQRVQGENGRVQENRKGKWEWKISKE